MLDPLLLFTSFVAGILTILAPCVLPLLPVIVGGAIGTRNKWHPFILTTSLAVSVILFTLLLKVSTLFINIPQEFWKAFSGGIILFFGLTWLFPRAWELISVKLNLLGRSQTGLMEAGRTESNWGAVLMGAALGPVFSSCSPTYFVILATVLPVSFVTGLVYLIAYAIGLALMLGLIAFFGRKITTKLGWAADPHGLFKKVLGIILVVVGLAVISGYDKKIESAILDAGFGVTKIENGLLDNAQGKKNTEVKNNGGDQASLPLLYNAPELVGLENWINSKPISSMEELRGKVVLVDFWTYSCINCIRTLPYLESWQEKYAADGLVILAIHAPEFQFERKFENVQKAVKDFGLTYPVVQDNDFKTWRAYNNRYWPAKYLIDQNGVVRFTHFGEGNYDETEKHIAELLKTSMKVSKVDETTVNFAAIGTPETYLGLEKRENYIKYGADPLQNNEWTLKAPTAWEELNEKIVSKGPESSIRMKFTASRANLVIGGTGTATVKIDGALATPQNAGKDVHDGRLTLDGERLYELTNFGDQYAEHEIEVIFDQKDTEVFSWTFG